MVLDNSPLIKININGLDSSKDFVLRVCMF